MFKRMVIVRFILILFLVAISNLQLFPALAAGSSEEAALGVKNMVANPKPSFKVDIWTDRGDGALYSKGEEIKLHFKADRDCYVMIFDLTPSSEVKVIFPTEGDTSASIKGGKVYTIPSKEDSFKLMAVEPEGVEAFKIIATSAPMQIRKEDLIEGRDVFPTVRENAQNFIFRLKDALEVLPFEDWAEDTLLISVGRLSLLSTAPEPLSPAPTEIVVRPELGGIFISSDPSDADVYINGKYLGRTPFDTDNLLAGEYRVKMVKSGYWNWEETVTIREEVKSRLDIKLAPKLSEVAAMEGEGMEVQQVEVQPYQATGSLTITSEPSQSAVFLEGSYKGETPINLKNLQIGRTYHLRISKMGYKDWEADVSVKREQTEVINVKLLSGGYEQQSNIGVYSVESGVSQVILAPKSVRSLTVKSNPSGAAVYVDGVYMGSTPLAMTGFIAGNYYTIKLIRNGYENWERTIVIYEDGVGEVNAELIPIKEVQVEDYSSGPIQLELYTPESEISTVAYQPYDSPQAASVTIDISQVRLEIIPSPRDNRYWGAKISYRLSRDAFVTFSIYDSVNRLVKGWPEEFQSAGSNSLIWDGQDKRGKFVGKGDYIYRLEAVDAASGEKIKTTKEGIFRIGDPRLQEEEARKAAPEQEFPYAMVGLVLIVLLVLLL